MDFFSINTVFLHIPVGEQGYNLSYIEAVGTLAGLLCIWLASKERVINYLFGIINVVLFAVIFFQIQLYASLLLQVFFLLSNIYGWYAWTRVSEDNQVSLHIRWLSARQRKILLIIALLAIGIMTLYIDPIFAFLAKSTVGLLNLLAINVTLPELLPDAYPFWDACMTVLSVLAMLLMTRKYVENWLLWVIINVISVGTYTLQGVYAMSLEYLLLTAIAANGVRLWMNKAR